MKQALLDMVERYRLAIGTQQTEDFLPLWSKQVPCTLVSPSGCYTGVESIYQDFLLGRIRKAYSRIELITHSVDVRMAGDCAIVLFAYSTDCTLRGSDEPFGIAGLETQVYTREADGWKLTHVHYSADKQ